MAAVDFDSSKVNCLRPSHMTVGERMSAVTPSVTTASMIDLDFILLAERLVSADGATTVY